MFITQGRSEDEFDVSCRDMLTAMLTIDCIAERYVRCLVENRLHRRVIQRVSNGDMLKKERFFVDISALKKAYLPMSEPMLYILLSLKEPLHGYGIIKYVKELTEGRLTIGYGTLYGILGKLQKAGVICIYDEIDNRILYELTSRGKALLGAEIERLSQVMDDIRKVNGDE